MRARVQTVFTAMASYLAMVKQTEDGATIPKRVADNPTTAADLRTKIKAQKLEATETKRALKDAIEQEIAPKRFKRAVWADADVLPVSWRAPLRHRP